MPDNVPRAKSLRENSSRILKRRQEVLDEIEIGLKQKDITSELARKLQEFYMLDEMNGLTVAIGEDLERLFKGLTKTIQRTY